MKKIAAKVVLSNTTRGECGAGAALILPPLSGRGMSLPGKMTKGRMSQYELLQGYMQNNSKMIRKKKSTIAIHSIRHVIYDIHHRSGYQNYFDGLTSK